MSKLFGKYCIAKPFDDNCAAKLIGPDNIVGDIYKVTTNLDNDSYISFVTNRFNQSPAFFDEETSREIAVCEARGLKMYAILSLVGFSENSKQSKYWGEFALIGFPKSMSNIFDKFIINISKEIREGKRISVDFSDSDYDRIIKTDGCYTPNHRVPLPEKENGTIFLKTSMSFKERLIEHARNRNIGCFIGGWLFLLLFVSIIILIGKVCFGF